jgi:hypothetical protein
LQVSADGDARSDHEGCRITLRTDDDSRPIIAENAAKLFLDGAVLAIRQLSLAVRSHHALSRSPGAERL